MNQRNVLVVLALALVGLFGTWLLLGGDDETAKTADEPPAEAATRPTAAAERSPPAGTVADEDSLGQLRGEVRSADGKSIAGAVVSLTRRSSDDDAPIVVRTDAEGAWSRTGLAVGRYAVSGTAPGHLPAVASNVEVTRGSSEPVVLTLQPGGERLHGTVLDITGGVVDGATVRAIPQQGLFGNQRFDAFAALSDDEGRYALFVTPGRYRLVVTHDDYAQQRRDVAVGPGARAQDFSLVPTGVVEGIVLDEASGEPVPRAVVSYGRERELRDPMGGKLSMTVDTGVVRADAQGRFRIGGVEPGVINLTARASKLAPTEAVSVDLGIAEQARDVEVFVTPAYDVRGRVTVQGSEEPVASAAIELDDEVAATSAEDGTFVVHGVPPGAHRFRANASGYLPLGEDVSHDVQADVDELDLSVRKGLSIRGRVEPAEVTDVSLELDTERISGPGGMVTLILQARTDSAEDGTFELEPVTEGPKTVIARAADGRVGEVTVDVGPDGADDVVIRLEERARVRGRVTDSAGVPVEGATVSLQGGDPRRRVSIQINGMEMSGHKGTTADTGEFEISGLPDGDYRVTINDRYGDALPVVGGAEGVEGKARLNVAAGETLEGVELVVEARNARVEGSVRTAEGEPAPDVWVTVHRVPVAVAERLASQSEEEVEQTSMVIVSGAPPSGERPPVLTDAQGNFEFSGLSPGRYEVLAEARGGGARVSELVDTDADVTLKLLPLGSVEGTVSIDGEPVQTFAVSVNGATRRSTAVRDGGGRYEVERLDPGRYTVTARTPLGSGSAEVTVEPGRAVRADIRLERALSVKGRIVDASGRPLAGLAVLIGEGEDGRIEIRRDGSEEQITTDEDGAFETSCAPGSRVLLVLDPAAPRPKVTKFFTAELGKPVDLGDLPAEDAP